MSDDPREHIPYLQRRIKTLEDQIQFLLKELGWSKETINKWKKGELTERH